MPKLAEHRGDPEGYHVQVTTTISVEREHTIITEEDNRPFAKSKTIIKFRNCPHNRDAALQFQCEKVAQGKRGVHFSFSIPEPLVNIFLERLRVLYTPPKL